MSDLVFHPQTKQRLDSIVKKLPQSVLITGNPGIGLKTIGKFIADKKSVLPLVMLPEKNEKIDEENGVIGVNSIRRLYTDTRSKMQAGAEHLVIIHRAEKMTHQAQNAFLKLLEEPNSYTRFILTTHYPSALLPTIISRVQTTRIRAITTKQSEKLLDSLGIKDETRRRQLLFTADGLPAELTKLAMDEEKFKQRSLVIKDAKKLLQDTPYQRLLIIQKYKDSRSAALSLVSDAASLLSKTMVEKPSSGTLKRMNSVLSAHQRLERNANTRLALLEAFI